MAEKTILIVDDSPTDLHALRTALEPGGYAILTATDGEEALRRASRERPDLILLDVILPRMNGFEVCRVLKSDPQTSEIKVVLVSCKREHSDRFWGLKQGAVEYVTKPFEKKDLLDVVARHV